MARIAKLERIHPAAVAGEALDIDLPPDLRARIAKAQETGTFPDSLADADLQAIVRARDDARGRA